MRTIIITAGSVTARAELNDSPTATALWEALPIAARANTWGDEIYFGIPVHTDEEPGAREVVTVGEIGYWPPGHAFCIFFGRTPASRGSEIRAASAINPLGTIVGDARVFKQVRDGEKVTIAKAEEPGK
ncbi:MAG TPA: cyclophilin-like fold protein [Anaerolineae bacterium]|nr:cyclophilin-like fold protein [Anaerolineae bacterium]HOR00711.1 cyclophilin-like fold protein [Anaerolineae bacterium]HPL28959.1 cyclophilin-like fold protein [Anaerolineae bacterium]